ncbi:hypothetical protein SKAU_G00323580 [Synaphobranchus kaupii]|uniref:Uncharacterized protein n=1 Tax=Synaphobranchus kaupii TaxID=118154 RepID=A0A9Q1EPB3_SYNKA|nr:hypothetical protein SKAU_G00323580 [Synaphobranchus kaupii]
MEEVISDMVMEKQMERNLGTHGSDPTVIHKDPRCYKLRPGRSAHLSHIDPDLRTLLSHQSEPCPRSVTARRQELSCAGVRKAARPASPRQPVLRRLGPIGLIRRSVGEMNLPCLDCESVKRQERAEALRPFVWVPGARVYTSAETH